MSDIEMMMRRQYNITPDAHMRVTLGRCDAGIEFSHTHIRVVQLASRLMGSMLGRALFSTYIYFIAVTLLPVTLRRMSSLDDAAP
jgi:hypothetical protein